MNEAPNNLGESQNPVMPPTGSEGRAMFAGFTAAVVWFYLVEFMFSILERNVDNQSYHLFLRDYKLGWIAAVVLALAHGTFVGYVSAWTARSQAYVLAISVVFFVNYGCLQNIWSHLANAMVPLNTRLFWFFILIVLPIISMAGALNGAYLAQSTKQRRFVHIQ